MRFTHTVILCHIHHHSCSCVTMEMQSANDRRQFSLQGPCWFGLGGGWGRKQEEKTRGGWIVTNERLCVWACAGMCVCENVQVCVFFQLPLSRRGLQRMHLSLLLGKTSIHGYLHIQSGVNVDVGACFIHVCVCVCACVVIAICLHFLW